MFYREHIFQKLDHLSFEESQGYCKLHLPQFNQIFGDNNDKGGGDMAHEVHGGDWSAQKSWKLAFEAGKDFWQDFSSWFEQDDYNSSFNNILEQLIWKEESVISKRKWLRRCCDTKIPYLCSYAKNKLQNINKENMQDFFKMRLIKELGRTQINQNPDQLDIFMTRMQLWLKGISSFLAEIDVDFTEQFFANYGFDLAPPYYFEFKNNKEEFIWIKEKIKYACDIIPDRILLEEGLQKIIRVMIAHVIFVLNSLDESLDLPQIDRVIFRAIQSGFYYGLSHPLIDDISDSSQYLNNSLRDTMEYLVSEGLSGAPIDTSLIPENPIAYSILDIFDKLQRLYPREKNTFLWDSFYVLYQAQIKDRKDINANYSDEEVYVPIILKAAFSRIVAGAFTRNISRKFVKNTFLTALIAQLTDDLRDQQHDEKLGQFTPFTWNSRSCANYNPFELYIAAMVYLNIIHGKDSGASEASIYVMITALINLYKKKGEKAFNLHLDKLKIGDSKTKFYLIKLTRLRLNREDPEILMKRNLKYIGLLIKERHILQNFQTYMHLKKPYIENILPITSSANFLEKQRLVEAMNYSVKAGGKRIRPMIALMTADYYGIDNSRIIPLLRSLEYLHSASLILDDLPAQDNASLRRGQPTNHLVYGESTAQLAAVSLISLAFGQMAELKSFSSDLINKVTHYASKIMGHNGIAAGQYIDLQDQISNVEELKQLSYFKTGLGIEACICTVAMLAEAPDDHMVKWKSFARNLGILFQIKDDILDVEGDSKTLGKNPGIDQANNTATFVSILGINPAYSLLEEIWLASRQDLESLDQEGRNTESFRGLADFIIFRNN